MLEIMQKTKTAGQFPQSLFLCSSVTMADFNTRPVAETERSRVQC